MPQQTSERSRGAGALVAATALVFLSSVFIMTLELVAARLVAQYLGVSLYTWTSVIGVVLAGITAGNYVGGKLADLYPPRGLLAALFLLASVLCLSVLFLVDWMGTWSRPEYLSWPLWILRNVALVFLLPSAVLGMISPVAARLALAARDQIGATVGTLYAAGAAGSILGTFLTGYFLIDTFGSKTIVCAIAVGLGALGLLVAIGMRPSPWGFFAVWLWLAVTVSVFAVGPWPWAMQFGYFFGLRWDTSHLIHQDESSYFAIEIYDAEELDDTRVLALDHLVHSYVAMDDPTRLEYGYETVYAAITARLAPTDRPFDAFFIGGGGFTFPRYLEATYPLARIDVAEIDPAVKRAAQLALGLPPDDQTRIRTATMDARNYLADLQRSRGRGETTPRFDFVYGDAFNDLGVPFHLTTEGFNEALRRIMHPDGVYLINIIDVYREGYGRFLGAYVGTILRTFPFVYVFSGDPEGTSQDRDTFVVVAAGRRLDLAELGQRPGDLEPQGTLFAWSEDGDAGGEMTIVLERGRGVVLTDDYAPVDNLLAPVFALQQEESE
jgi:spermidine synthase